jgi:hypothetical protein
VLGRMEKGGRSSVVEFQPSKLAVVGSNPIARSIQNLFDLEPLTNGLGDGINALSC